MRSSSESIKRILVPVSLSPRPHEVLKEADRLAAATGAQVVLLHVVDREIDSLGLGSAVDGTTEARVQHCHSDLIDLASRELGRRTEFATAVIAHPDRVEAIHRYSQLIGADFIVLESRDDQAGEGGSLSQKLLGRAECPVVLVRTGRPLQRMAA